jgi:hypothetical protein
MLACEAILVWAGHGLVNTWKGNGGHGHGQSALS